MTSVTETCGCGASLTLTSATIPTGPLAEWRRDHQHGPAHPDTTPRHECQLPIMLDMAWDTRNPPTHHCGGCARDWTYGVIQEADPGGQRRVVGWQSQSPTDRTGRASAEGP